MQHVALLAVGSLKTSWVRAGAEDYLRRLRDVSVLELQASKAKEPLKQAAEESEKILAKMKDFDGETCVLDERGVSKTSKAFAATLQKLSDRGTSVLFVLGGAYGLTDAVRSTATHVLRLSDMTLPHELCRLLFLEQLYRAQQIQKGSGYHHG